MNKKGAYPSKYVNLCEIFHNENYLSLEKIILMAKFANHCFLQETAYKGGYIDGFFNPSEKNLPAQK